MMTLYAFELTAERYLNDEWVPIRLRNETWDGWIACEVGCESLKPDREELWADQLPEWAVAKPRGPGLGSVITGPPIGRGSGRESGRRNVSIWVGTGTLK